MKSIKECVVDKFKVGSKEYTYYSLKRLSEKYKFDLFKLPNTLKILLENLVRNADGSPDSEKHIRSVIEWIGAKSSKDEVSYQPARVLMQDFTGVPAIVDLAAMRDAVSQLGGDPNKINPLSPVDLVIDHSVQVDKYASDDAFEDNVKLEFDRNYERYKFLKWGQGSFDNFRVVPPGIGICHQVNLEYLSKVVWIKEEKNEVIAFPDTLVGTDSHTTMVNALGVLGWGVGGIEAEAAMLGQSISMVVPEVIGFEIKGKLKEGITATDLVLTVTQMLRQKGVVGKFVEFFGDGLETLTLADRATISNMSPEYGATCGFFPVDDKTVKYLDISGRSNEEIELVEKYCKLQGLWSQKDSSPEFTDSISLDLSDVEPCVAGPKRPQDKIKLCDVKQSFVRELENLASSEDNTKRVSVKNQKFSVGNGSVVIAAITSCTNTSNPNVMIAAGLVAKKAAEYGLSSKPWVKTSLAPGSQVVSEYLDKSGLQKYLDKLGFNLVGYGCTTCIGNSGPLQKEISDAIVENNLVVSSVLSGNRNFEGRVHPLVKTNYLASPPLVVVYAIAGTMNIDLTKDPVGISSDGRKILLKDLWPTTDEILKEVNRFIHRESFVSKYSNVFKGDKNWCKIKTAKSKTYHWEGNSTYINNPPYFHNMKIKLDELSDVKNARIIALLGDSVTTDHISPAGSIAKNSPAAKYLTEKNVHQEDFNSYGSRRGNHEVMMRGTFANIRIKNELAPGTEGGYTTLYPENKVMPIYDAAMEYKKREVPLIVIAGKEYGTGSSRDWAAKGTKLLGVEAVITESFERIHRSNLIGMGVMPFVFENNLTREDMKLKGNESFNIIGIKDHFTPNASMSLIVNYAGGESSTFPIRLAVFTQNEISYIKNGGILNKVIRDFL
ncbi:MAG: aconitate hydratase AcnA [Rickettsiales bacterium]